jgi:chromosome segregation ATPase
MDNLAEPTTNLDTRNVVMKWVDEMQDVIKGLTSLIEERDRHRAVAESTQRERDDLRLEVGKLRIELERARGLTESTQRERDDLREENDRLRTEQAEAAETAAKLLSDMKELVNRVAPAPPRLSPFIREPRTPQA